MDIEELRVKFPMWVDIPTWNKHSLVRVSGGGIVKHTVKKYDSRLLSKLVPKIVLIHGAVKGSGHLDHNSELARDDTFISVSVLQK